MLYFIRKRLLIPSERATDLAQGKTGVMTDDYAKTLEHPYQAVASAMFLRDDFNYTRAHFAKYPIDSPLEEYIREHQQHDRLG